MGEHLEKKDQKKKQRYKATFQRITKVMFLASAIMLIAVAALRFTVLEQQNMHEGIMDFFFLFFGIILAL